MNFEINIPNRDRNIHRPIMQVVTIKSGEKSANLKDLDSDLKTGYNYGMTIRMQSPNTNIPRVSYEGNPLLNLGSFGGAFLKIKDPAQEWKPIALEWLGFDKHVDEPGDYAFLVLPHGIKLDQSIIELKGAAPTADEDIEIYFLPFSKSCTPVNICPQ